jgi:hypothetical protein
MPRGTGLDHAEPVRTRECFNPGNIGWIGAMTFGVRLAGEVFAPLWGCSGQSIELRRKVLLCAPTHTYGYFEALVWMCLTKLLGVRDRLFVAAGEWNTILLGHERTSLCCC